MICFQLGAVPPKLGHVVNTSTRGRIHVGIHIDICEKHGEVAMDLISWIYLGRSYGCIADVWEDRMV